MDGYMKKGVAKCYAMNELWNWSRTDLGVG